MQIKLNGGALYLYPQIPVSLGRFRTVSDGFGRFRTVFGPFSDGFGSFSDGSILNLKFQISIGQGWGPPSRPVRRAVPAPALAN